MSVAKSLPDISPFFMQTCPICSRDNRMVVKGTYKLGDKIELYPDMGYSFCNCKNLFYTRKENLVNPVSYDPDKDGIITLPDPFFAWPNPYDFHYWDVRRYEIIWDLFSLLEVLSERGFIVEKYWRDFDVNSSTPQHYHIAIKP